MKISHPELLFAATMLAVGLACSAAGGDLNTPSLAVTHESSVPTNTLSLTAPAATVVPTPTKKPAFFVQEFDPGFAIHDWQSFILGKGTTDNLVVKQEASRLVFDLGNEDIYVYYMYKPYTYGNVTLTINAENLGRNNNTVSLVCRMNETADQWYEFSVTSSGLWSLYAVDNIYHLLGSGGANALNQGQGANELSMACINDEIRLSANGKQIKTIKETNYGFKQGFVGFNISSIQGYSVLPIIVAVDSFEIAPVQ